MPRRKKRGRLYDRYPHSSHETNWFAKRVGKYRKQGFTFKQAVRKAKKWGATATFKQRYG